MSVTGVHEPECPQGFSADIQFMLHCLIDGWGPSCKNMSLNTRTLMKNAMQNNAYTCAEYHPRRNGFLKDGIPVLAYPYFDLTLTTRQPWVDT